MVTFKALSIAGLGVLGAGAVSVGGYAISTIGGTSSSNEENTKPSIAPAINKWLLDSGYTFNPPQFASYEKLAQGCHENLIKNKRTDGGQNFEHNKLYGCGVAKMDLWDSEDQFGGEKVNYLIFGSEIFLRKGHDAWRISTLIDNYSSDKLIYRHLLSFLDQQNDGSWLTTEAFLIDEEVKEANQKGLQQEEQRIALSVGKEELNIKVPGTNGSWFKKDNFLIRGTVPPGSTLTKTNQKTKEWSGIWIEDSSKPSQGMFQDIEVFIGNQENEQVFCKDKNKCGSSIGSNYKISYTWTHKEVPNTWNEAYTALTDPKNADWDDMLRHENGATTPILNFIKASKGKWSSSNDVCNPKSTEVEPEELKKLKVFCSKSSS